jgi:hypothetical protein
LFVIGPEASERMPVNVPAAAGVPLIKPLEALIKSPPGRPVAL